MTTVLTAITRLAEVTVCAAALGVGAGLHTDNPTLSGWSLTAVGIAALANRVRNQIANHLTQEA